MASPPQDQSTGSPSMLDLDHLVQKVQDVREKMLQLQEELHERKKNEALQGSSQQSELDPTKSEVQKLETHIQQLEDNMKEMATKRIQLLNECTDCLDQCQSRWISRLKEWKWEQQKAVIGHHFDDDLDLLQSWCEQLFEVNKTLREELQLVGEPMSELQDRLVKLLKVLVQSSLVVSIQPPQVIQILSKFFTTVRCLLCEKVKPVMLKAKIINELQARDLDSELSDDCGSLFNNTATLEPDTTSEITRATFWNMCIEKIKRPDSWSSKPETEQKFSLLFSTEIFIPGCDTPCRIQIISLPVVVMNDYFQDSSSAQATILWDCAFSEADRVPFMVPEQVPWSTMLNTLNSKFTDEVQTHHSLDQHNQQGLAQKIFNKPDCGDDFSNMMVSWAQFNEVLPGQRFTFWEWFEGLMKLTEKHLKTYWSEGLIFGVIGEQKLHQILRNSPAGTFLLHFSDSEIGGITITYVSAAEKGEPKIKSIPPFTKRELYSRNLGDRIRDIHHITHLYPDIPKDEAFKRFYSEPLTSQDYIHIQSALRRDIWSPRLSWPCEEVDISDSEWLKGNSRDDQSKIQEKYKKPFSTFFSLFDLHDDMVDQPPPATLTETGMIKYQPPAADAGFYDRTKGRDVFWGRALMHSDSPSPVTDSVKGSCWQDSSARRLLDIRSSFINGISGPVLGELLDELLEKMVLNYSERESADEIQNHKDKARFVIDTVRKKGEAASSEMMEVLREVDPFFCKHKGKPKIQSVSRFTDLNIRSLGNRSQDVSHLPHLYPDRPKHEAFKHKHSETEPQMSQYFKSLPLQSGLSRPPRPVTGSTVDISGSKDKRSVGSHSVEILSPKASFPSSSLSMDSGSDSDAGVEMKASDIDVKSSVTNIQSTHSHPQLSSGSGWSERDSSCLSRSHSVPSLSQTTSPENRTFTPSQSLPDMSLKSSFEEFTPDIIDDEDDETYRFQCSCPGLYQCSVTGLVFHMEGEGDVVYRTVPWDRRLLAQHHKQPAGPLFDIKCLQQSVCQLHLPHCEIRSTGGCEFLSVAHVNDEGIEFIVPQKITETHVIINITGFSAFGNVKDEDSPPDPVRALVLLFYRPPADPDPESLLNVLLLPVNIVLRDVLHDWNKLVGDEIYIETSSHCKLSPNQEYTLSTCPEDDSVLVEPTEAEFYCDNYDIYFSSFQVILEKNSLNSNLVLRDTKSSSTVWEGEVDLLSTAVRGSSRQGSSSERLLDIRSSFISRISGPVLKSLLDKLLEKTVLTDSERELADEIQNHRDKARFVVDTVRKKGEAASSEMIEFLCEVDPFLCEHREPKIKSITPFTERDLELRNLEPQTSQYGSSVSLHPGISRDIWSPTLLRPQSEVDISGSKWLKGNSRFYRAMRRRRKAFTVASSIDLHDDMLDLSPPVTLTETEMTINQSPAAEASTGFSQDNIWEMDLHEPAGPSTLQLSTSDSAAVYDRTKERDEMLPDSPASPVTDDISHPPSREDTDDGGSSCDNSSSTFSRPSCSQSTATTVCGPPCPQDSPVVLQDSTVCTEGSRAQDAFELLSLQSEGESGGDSDAAVNMESAATAVKSSVTNIQRTHSHLQLSSSGSGWSERDSSCLSRSHSVPSLSQRSSVENKNFTRSQSLPDMLLKSSFEEFTPDITDDEDDETYWFQCSCPGLYQCSVTGLVFHMEGEGDVVYRTVPWDRRLLAQHHKQPAGPLFDIKCLQQSVCQLHLPHCEIRSTGGCEFLSVAHVNDEDIEFIVPQKITETHVIINITGFSAFGNVKDEDSPPDPVRALVLLFYRPPADPDPDLPSFLKVLMLPRNVVIRDVVRTRYKLDRNEIYLDTNSKCHLYPKQEYTLSTCPEDDSVRVLPKKEAFEPDSHDNYITSFQVRLKTNIKIINLILRDTNTSSIVWEGEVCPLSIGVKRSCMQGSSSEKLFDIRSRFVKKISEPNLKSLLDELFEKGVITDPERQAAAVYKDDIDKARYVIDTVRQKGEVASLEMIESLCKIDSVLCEDLGLI